jgi:ribosomal protein L37E
MSSIVCKKCGSEFGFEICGMIIGSELSIDHKELYNIRCMRCGHVFDVPKDECVGIGEFILSTILIVFIFLFLIFNIL